MCLYIDEKIHGPLKRIKKAKEDIVCYKVLCIRNGNLFTPSNYDEKSFNFIEFNFCCVVCFAWSVL